MTNKPWLRFYEPHVPEHIAYPTQTLPEILNTTAQKHYYRRAMIFKGGRISYGEFNRAVNRLAAGLQKLGVKKGDRVAVHLPNCPQFPIAYYALLRIGAIVVPCNPIYQAHEMVHQLSDSGAKVIVTLSSTYNLIKNIRAETDLEHVIVAQIKTHFPPITRALFTLALEEKMGHRVNITGHAFTYWFTDIINNAPMKPEPVTVTPDDTAVLMYTGGTTGVSKGAELTHRNLVVNAYQCKVWLNAKEAEHVTLVQIPLFHSYGMTIGMNLSVLIASTMLLVPDPRDFDDVIGTIVRYRPTLYPGVPAMYNALINHPKSAKYDLRSIKLCISGASALPVQVQEKFQALTGARLVEGYGLSEASPVTHANPLFGENRIGTIGLPWPDTEVKLVDTEMGEAEVAEGEAGELCIRGPQVMKGYWNNPAETQNVLRYDAKGGAPWLYTGDIATMDEDGYFRIVDRKKDVVIGTGGYKIFPREIEEVLYQHPKVLEAAAVGVPSEDKGDRVKIFVALKPGETATAEEIIGHCQANLAPYKVPKHIEFRESLPKTITGKPLRRILRTEEMNKQKPKPVEPEREKVTQ
jgi:long-chain acyl-CoA synthetase